MSVEQFRRTVLMFKMISKFALMGALGLAAMGQKMPSQIIQRLGRAAEPPPKARPFAFEPVRAKGLDTPAKARYAAPLTEQESAGLPAAMLKSTAALVVQARQAAAGRTDARLAGDLESADSAVAIARERLEAGDAGTATRELQRAAYLANRVLIQVGR